MPDLPSGTVTFLFTDIEGSTKRWEHQQREMQAALATTLTAQPALYQQAWNEALRPSNVISRLGQSQAMALEQAIAYALKDVNHARPNE